MQKDNNEKTQEEREKERGRGKKRKKKKGCREGASALLYFCEGKTGADSVDVVDGKSLSAAPLAIQQSTD